MQQSTRDESLHRLLGQHTADPTDVAQVEVRGTADALNLDLHVQVFVKTTPGLRT